MRFDPVKDALFLDIDGTLLDIAPTAKDVKVLPILVKNLARLNEKLDGALALISGRMIQDVDLLFDPLRLRCAGAHGAELRASPFGPVESSQFLPDFLRDEIRAAFKGMQGITVEDKMYNVAVHYRKSPQNADKIESTLKRIIQNYDKNVVLIHGRKVFEVSLTSYNKGQAIERLLKNAPFKNRRPVFLGDDTTDISAIGACMKYGGIAARVGQGKPNQKNAFDSPAMVRSWIEKIAGET